MRPPPLAQIDLGDLETDDPVERIARARRVRDQLVREYSRRTPEEDERHAYHEAGHVVMAWLGNVAEPTRCSLRPWSLEACAQTRTRTTGAQWMQGGALEFALAGTVAASVHSGRPIRLSHRDREQALQALSWRLHAYHVVIARERGATPPRPPSTCPDELSEDVADPILNRFRRLLTRLVEREEVWEAITAVARALVRWTTLGETRLEYLRNRHEPPEVLWSFWQEERERFLRREAERLWEGVRYVCRGESGDCGHEHFSCWAAARCLLHHARPGGVDRHVEHADGSPLTESEMAEVKHILAVKRLLSELREPG